ncbi:MerR family DNA-binding transcriptional regulator [Streptomyces inhibens]|uniref:helix-turn-helix domain-containing protein n=1 Tax=Streptomyces inhibens TaxID=2293571 RepID=UPI001EE73257|nr:MerR family transcriptional regulator [Streptomyces inhibens]UKY49405.1 MerR family transcriptional regulator [Streptomyces inhibens]
MGDPTVDGMYEDGTGLLTIGALARLTGIPVKTIRNWSDADLLPPAARTPAGYRLYGPDAPPRLEIVRSLRELGIGTAAIRSVLHRELPHSLNGMGGPPSFAETAAQWADALDAQILPHSLNGMGGPPSCGCSAPCCVRWPRGAAQQRSCRT